MTSHRQCFVPVVSAQKASTLACTVKTPVIENQQEFAPEFTYI